MNHPFHYGITVKPVHKDLKRDNFKGEKCYGKYLSNYVNMKF